MDKPEGHYYFNTATMGPALYTHTNYPQDIAHSFDVFKEQGEEIIAHEVDSGLDIKILHGYSGKYSFSDRDRCYLILYALGLCLEK